MIQQGLGALMPQQPSEQAPANPVRMAAAMDVVTSDAEENILDPRTLALLKYKDAVRAMQAADQMMAAAQPQPMPPTVAERTRLAAEQGIAGLAQRLAPGVQQRGAQIAAQQGAGGLPQLAAPNMARMAGGGIVAFQKGGGPLPTAGGREEDYVVTTDELGNPIYASDIARALAAGAMDTSEEGAARRAAYAALQTDRPNLREIARTPEGSVSSAERVPTAGYGMGDRTGQGEVLTGMASGVADSVRRGLGSLVPTGMSDEEIAAEAAVTRGAAPRETRGEDPRARTTSALDSAYLSGLGGAQLQQLNDAIEKDPSMANKVIDWVVENPYDAISLGLMAVPGIGLAGNVAFKALGAVARSPRVIRAMQSLVTKPKVGPKGGTLPVPFGARQFDPGRAMFTAGTGMTAAGQVYDGMGGEGDAVESGAADAPTAATEMVAPDAVEALVGQQSPSEPAARRPVERISEEEALAAISPSGPKDAFEYLMAYGQAPEREQQTAAATPQSRDDRMRRIIAGLRGLGAQGVGGFSAGVAEEAARMDQEAIAEQQRRAEEKFRERELAQADREMNLTDALRREQLAADIRDRQEEHQLRMAQLEAGKQEFLQEQIAKNAQRVRDMINMLEASILMGDDSPDKQNQLLALRDQELRIIEETEASLAGYMTPAEGQSASTLNANDFTVRQVTQ